MVSGAAGGVGTVAVRLARRTGATVIGLASEPNHAWLAARGIVPVSYGDGQAERIQTAAAGPISAFIDTFGGGYAEVAIELGVTPDRVNTIIDFPAFERLGIHAEGTAFASTVEPMREVAELLAAGELDLPIAATYPLDRVRDAYRELALRKTRGKIVLVP